MNRRRLLLLLRKRGAAAPPPWSPTDIAGLKCWLKADALSLSDGDPVASWTDSSGSGNHATQSVSAKKPTYWVNGGSGYPAVSFDGTDDVLSASFSGGNAQTIFLVAKATDLSGRTYLDSPSANYQYFLYRDSGASVAVYNGPNLSRSGVTYTSFILITALVDGANSLVKVNASSEATGTLNVRATSGFALGIASGEGGHITVAELLFYDAALDATDRGLVQGYLNAKYGIY